MSVSPTGSASNLNRLETEPIDRTPPSPSTEGPPSLHVMPVAPEAPEAASKKSSNNGRSYNKVAIGVAIGGAILLAIGIIALTAIASQNAAQAMHVTNLVKNPVIIGLGVGVFATGTILTVGGLFYLAYESDKPEGDESKDEVSKTILLPRGSMLEPLGLTYHVARNTEAQRKREQKAALEAQKVK